MHKSWFGIWGESSIFPTNNSFLPLAKTTSFLRRFSTAARPLTPLPTNRMTESTVVVEPPCGFKSVQSKDDICTTQKEIAENGSDLETGVFNSTLLPPFYYLVAYIAVLKYMTDHLRQEAARYPETDVFKSVWWSSPIFFTVFYLSAVFIGVHVMKDRKEMKIKPYIFTYNLYQCVLNLGGVIAMVMEVYTNPWYKAPWGNFPQPGPEGFHMSYLVWLHYINKYVELLDTLWMVLRKKNNQISFLHCYHHVLLIWAWFLVCKVGAGGDSYFGAAVNSFIHVIMYGYYTLALLNVPCPWKKWITNCQMVQFMVCLVHAVYTYIKANVPRILSYAQGFVMVNMLVLFGHFYVQSYLRKKDKVNGGKSKAL